jgi:hypothetical protein
MVDRLSPIDRRLKRPQASETQQPKAVRRRRLRVEMVDRALASDFVVLVLSEAVLSETVLVLDGCLKLGDADR